MPADANITRRGLIVAASAGLGALLVPGTARAFGGGSQLDVGEIMLPSATLSRPAAWQRLLFEVIQATSVECNPAAVQLDPQDPELFAHPFCVLIGDGPLPTLSEDAVEQLVRYLNYGGFLLIDDATGIPDGPFARSVRALCRRLFPTRALSPLPSDHSIFRAFFLLDRPVGRVDSSPSLEGVTMGKITPLVFCPNDLSGALDRRPDGRNAHPVTPGGEFQRREATKLGINLVLYSLTSNYKHDTAHVLELLREGRLE